MWCTVEQVSTVIQYGLSNSAESSGSHRLLRITDIQDNKVEWGNVPFTSITREQATDYLLEAGDIVFARTGATVGKSYIINEVTVPSVFASYLIRVKTTQVLPQYVKYFFECGTYWEQITDKSVGIGQPNVNGTKLKGLIFPLPPLAEQCRIVAAIKSAFTIIDEIESNKNDLQDAVTVAKSKVLSLAICGKLVPQDPNDEPASVLLERIRAEREVLIKSGKIKRDKNESTITRSSDNCYYENLPIGWTVTRLNKVGQIVGGGTPSTNEPSYWNTGNISWITPADLSGYAGKFIAEGSRKITKKGLAESSAVLMPAGSVLFSSRAPIGYCVIAQNEVCTNQGFKSIVPFISGASEYIYYHLKAHVKEISSRASGTTFKEISGRTFGNTIIALPPLAEQQRIVMAIEAAFQQLEQIAKELN
jgi:type I restriction enzyme S subunit